MVQSRFGDAEGQLLDARGFFLCIQAGERSRRSPAAWFSEHQAELRQALNAYGVIFFRGFDPNVDAFETAANMIDANLMPQSGGVSPRRQVRNSVYTSTDAPQQLGIVQHHEMAYHYQTPRYVGFYCDVPPQAGGATLVCDARRIASELDPVMVSELQERGVLYVRNYTDDNPLKGWAATYGTDDKRKVEAVLTEGHTEFRWLSEDWLQTRQRRPAIIHDEVSGCPIVFGCVHLWNRAYFVELARAYGAVLPDDPWRQWNASFYGDGEEIPERFITELTHAYQRRQLSLPWRQGDFMFVDNLIATHGRSPSQGPRRIYATLRRPVATLELT